jgi:hypothetical protein
LEGGGEGYCISTSPDPPPPFFSLSFSSSSNNLFDFNYCTSTFNKLSFTLYTCVFLIIIKASVTAFVGDGDDYQQYDMPTIFYRLKNENENEIEKYWQGTL